MSLIMQIDPMHHITGHYPLRLADAEDRKLPRWIVAFQQGFEQYQIAVYGDGLNEQDAEDAAIEFLSKDTHGYLEADYVFRG
jgi:hypothetical protein